MWLLNLCDGHFLGARADSVDPLYQLNLPRSVRGASLRSMVSTIAGNGHIGHPSWPENALGAKWVSLLKATAIERTRRYLKLGWVPFAATSAYVCSPRWYRLSIDRVIFFLRRDVYNTGCQWWACTSKRGFGSLPRRAISVEAKADPRFALRW
jgi:hypothetical protein